MENRGFFFSWLNLDRIFIFLHQLRISHLTRLTLPGSLDHRISIWMFRRSPWSDSAKAEGGKPAKSSWRQWRMRDVLWMTCRHTSWRSEKKRRKWPWWLRLVTSTSSAKKSTLSILSFKLLDPSKKMGENRRELPKFATIAVFVSCWFITRGWTTKQDNFSMELLQPPVIHHPLYLRSRACTLRMWPTTAPTMRSDTGDIQKNAEPARVSVC